MVRYYLEIEFEQTTEEIEDMAPQQIIRIETNSTEEAKQLYKKVKGNIENKRYKAYVHECNHSKEANKECKRIIIEDCTE